MGSLFGGESSVSYSQSPQQQAVWSAMQPLINRIAEASKPGALLSTGQFQDIQVPYTYNEQIPQMMQGPEGWYNTGLFDTVQRTGYANQQIPIMQQGSGGAGSQNYLWNIPQVPQAPQAIGPNAGWFSGLDPSIKQGLWEPYNEALNILGERMGAQGQYGSARGGYTNAYGEAAGKMGADYANQIGLQAWNMYAPYQNLQQERDWTMAQNQWASQLEASKYPYAVLPGLLGGSYASPVVSQSPNIFGSLASAGLMAGMFL